VGSVFDAHWQTLIVVVVLETDFFCGNGS